ncbi:MULTISPECIES: endopeptidase La [Anaerostipes]|uniref:endopeptidase La n=1 Tax=Anaerostipes TaxID=207244 RepID=UPI000952051D|nr:MULTISPECIES: endopeptidase La [Anaerostipes]MCI5624111.1 endopeptidase La [Anaerostipes sp.]MDY2726590.1 endopeptidase La [Anaerostipes faecalis]OLR60092.1 endopeptidase La [Anaerostipes sp. 494a]
MKKILPMLTLRGKYIFPNTVIHFDVSRSKSIRAIEEAMQNDQMIFLDNQVDPTIEDPGIVDLYSVGTLAKIRQVVKMPQNVVRVFAEGLFRAEMTEVCEEEPLFRVEVAYNHVEQQKFEPYEKEALTRAVKEAFQKYSNSWSKLDQNIAGYIEMQPDLELLLDQIATHLPFAIEDKQKILEEMDLKQRSETMLILLEEEQELIKLRNSIQQKVKSNVDKNQKEYMLREQMKVIREELGETNIEDEAHEFLNQLKQLNASKEVKEKIKKEIGRFQAIGGNSPENAVLRTYIETMLEIPWETLSKDSEDLEKAASILDEDHYGLEKVKERVLEYLAARAMSGKKDAAILCLAGPPGTGKTSIAKSIARATEKKYVRLSLGGVRDESEIRGHRKTYVGAMPGRIVEALKKVKVRNPLILLDEVDKTGKDQRGDTASALLEVLDPEQNEHFQDHYLEVPLNLSDVLFIATANDLSTIPRPLLDRMEVIDVSSYSENEKFHIAQQYLVKKQMEANGLTEKEIQWKEDAIRLLITSYTREAGVRNLERRIGQISRKVAKDIYLKKHRKVTITKKAVKDYLGNPPYQWEKDSLKNQIGVVHGLAWTSVGGETLKIEVNVMPGKGRIQVTGSLGDVMKESSQAAISYIRSQSRKYKIKADYFEKHDIHIHIPEGAVPKDGPSAGITMTTAVLSAITGMKVYGNLAMTGEVTIRGDVLPIGGLKEKLLAAKRLGIEKVLVPRSNEKDVREFHEEITEGLEIIYVRNMNQVIKQAFVEKEINE